MRKSPVPKTRKYPCCIRIERERAKSKNYDYKLLLFIKGRRVKASATQIAVLACLHDDQGHVVPYQRLGRILGYKSTELPQRHTLRQYVLWIKKTLAAHKALCVLAVVPEIGYVLCGHR